MAQGNLYILSAPSGAGKSSLISALLNQQQDNKMMVSVSHTTRQPRPGEQEGVHYYFVSVEAFESLIEQDLFLEYAKVFGGNYYGTSLPAIEENLAKGIDVFLDIDWQGAQQIRQKVPNVKSIFILPPSLAELERRLIGRGQDSTEVIAARMSKAIDEISHYNEYDYVIVNDVFEQALADFQAILRAERLTLTHQQKQNQALIEQLLAK
ncbi:MULTISPECIES: guanylate kinase [Pasteurella]|uniref:Guanylate kinase n=2 Tax=Gammaproteobacteria TaxID=1236 RepID=KGUA_PASMU|nr:MULTISPECIES: guanylate kinase [Pasteurella]P57888.1 RecName: Full=Guanylate kinase; AltName: Full=GMP kinase [Pasteurella multocida subsp. multocida str. Pm70]EGP04960.1 guanylate kinase [Pasteurella multocida subsp. multocida str. Anand1_goat]AAK03006.1 Gmk [Pasteurella multocida subsp. multocida str. Pm70]AMM81114.1 guanylate kinase [Pasteurella multocida subsp. multocida PMTB2.1]APW54898.1 guanylate kinase [Pasteurella multocida subsp. multocida str. HN07]APW57809.1 guanylate kinase [P